MLLTIHRYKPSMDRSLLPSLKRIRAFAISPAIAVAVALLEEPYRGYPSAPISLKTNLEVFTLAYFFVAIPLTAVFGCGTYILFSKRVRATLWLCMLIGALIGFAPLTILMLFSHFDAGTSISITQPGGVIAELITVASFSVNYAVAGAMGGVAFWLSAGSDFRHRRIKE